MTKKMMVEMMVERAKAAHDRQERGEYLTPASRRSHHGRAGEGETVLLEWEARLPLPVARTKVDLGDGRGIWIDAEPEAVAATIERVLRERRSSAVVYVSRPLPGSRTIEVKIAPLAVRQDRIKEENRESVERAQLTFRAHLRATRRTDPESVGSIFPWRGPGVDHDAPRLPGLADLIVGAAEVVPERPLRATTVWTEASAGAREVLG